MIRRATSEDAEVVAEVYVKSRRLMPYAKPVHTDEEIRDWIRNDLVPRGCVFLKEIAERPVGMVAVTPKEDGTWIDQLYVDPAFIRSGIGTELIRWIGERFRDPTWVYAFQKNDAASPSRRSSHIDSSLAKE